MTNKIEIYFPIYCDFPSEEYPFEQKIIIIKEINEVIKNGKKIIPNYLNVISTLAHIEEFNIKSVRHMQMQYLGAREDFFRVEIIVEVDFDLLKEQLNNDNIGLHLKTKQDCLDFIPTLLTGEFGSWIYEIIILSQIIRPGSLKLRKGKVLVDDVISSYIPDFFGLFRECLSIHKNKKYPKIQYLELQPFYIWILKNNLDFPIYPTNSYQKAINNLSYVNSVENNVAKIVYQIRILEGLYTNNRNRISEQLNTNIQLFLGEIITFKRAIKNMYNVRSCFMHGASTIVPFHKTNHWEYKYDKSYDIKIEDAVLFNQLLIIATLQKMYLCDCVDINCELKIKK